MPNYSLKSKFHYNLIFLFILILFVKDQEILNKYKDISNEDVYKVYLNNSTKIGLWWKKDDYKLLIHILSIDCEINLEVNKTIKFKNISSYINYAYYITKDYKENIYLTINPLISSIKEQAQKRNYPLIINTVKYSYFYTPFPTLNVKENEPIFLYFNSDLKSIQLVYTTSNIEQPIIVSFFIKEKIKFKIEISNQNNKIINKIINYKENIIFKPKSYYTNYDILISLDEENIIDSTMIVKIIQNNSSPIYLQKNQLNLGFIPIEFDYYYYYMEIFKGEKGEIMLFNKRQNGILKGKIIEKNNTKIPKEDEFPKYNENDTLSNKSLEFNIYNQKLSFNSSHIKECENGCFLLITYYSNISKSLDINGTEFSILSRIWNEEELKSQIINIPLEEYIFGYFNETTVNIHYYSVFIPNETDNVYIEIHGMNISGYYQEGISQINTTNMANNTKKLFEKCQNKMIIKLNPEDIELKSFKGEYISFAFEKDINDFHSSYYYFRILQQNYENNYTIYPLDTNKENYCETKNKKCFFLLRNEYNKLSNKIYIYNLEKNNISSKVIYLNESYYYSKDLNLTKLYEDENKEFQSINGLLSLDLNMSEHFILIALKSNEEKNLTIVPSIFYKQSISSSIDIYSYQLYHLPEKQFQQFNLVQNTSLKYRILINSTEGEGYICFDQTCDSTHNYIHITELKIYSFSIPNKESIFIYPKNNLTYNIKLIDEISNEIIKELNYQNNIDNINSIKESFPLIYFIKDTKYNGIYINFIFKFDDSNIENNNLLIKGYELDYSEMLSIKNNKDSILISSKEIEGKYDNITNIGTIELCKYNKNYNYLEDKYFMITIENITSFDFIDIKKEIYVFSIDKNYVLLPINQYIRNSFNLLENKNIIQKYFFEKEKISNKEFILEFSSNYDSIELIFNDLTNYSTPEIIGGFKKYYLSIESNNSNDYYFNVVIKPTNKLSVVKTLLEVNVIIKYYNIKDTEINFDYIGNQNFNLERISIKDNYSDYKLIISSNISESISFNSSNNLNFIYYLRLIKKEDILNYEELNTIASISSNVSYIDKYNTIESSKEFYFNLTNLENNESYIASFFIKVENKSKEEETYYYSMNYEFSTELESNNNTDNNNRTDSNGNTDSDNKTDIDSIKNSSENNYINMIVIFIFIFIIILILIISFIIWRKLRIKNRSLENKVNAIDFSSGINDDLINKKELSERRYDSYENTFI